MDIKREWLDTVVLELTDVGFFCDLGDLTLYIFK